MRIRLKSVASFLFFFVFSFTVFPYPNARAVDPPFISVDENGKRQGAFMDVSGKRTFLHLDLPEGMQAHLSIPSQHNWALPDVYTMLPAGPWEEKLWPKQGAINGKSWVGVEFLAQGARYGQLDRNLYLVIDLAGGETFKQIETNEPFAPFFLPYSGYFNPYLCALIKGIPFEKLLRDDVAVLMPYYDSTQKNLLFDLLPAISTGYDSLIVVPTRYSEATYYPVKVTPELIQELLATYQEAQINGVGTQHMGLELFRHAARFKLDFAKLPPLAVSEDTIRNFSDDLASLTRVLTADLETYFGHFQESIKKRPKQEQMMDVDSLLVQELPVKISETRAAAKEQLATALNRFAATAPSNPCEAVEGAAFSALWKDPQASEIRSKMTATLLEALDYWKLELKSNDRIEYDMMMAALITGNDPATFHLSGSQPYFVNQPGGIIGNQVTRILNQTSTEDDPLYGMDYYGMSIIASMVNSWDRAKELMTQTTQKFKEQIGEMNDKPLTIVQQYRALVWGKMVGSDRNPHRYRRMSGDYQENLARHQHCIKRKRQIELSSYNLSNFANQELHTRVRYMQSGVLNCGKKPWPPKKPKPEKPDNNDDKKPESDAVKNTRDRLKNFNNIRSLPGKIDGMFRVEAPSSNAGVAKFVLKAVKAPVPSGPFDIPEKMFNAMLDEILSVWDDALKALEMDPPRSDFQTFAEPKEETLPEELKEYPQAAQDFIMKSKLLGATLQAAGITFDRLGGARQAGNDQWELRQQIHLDSLKNEAGGLLTEVSDLIGDQASLVESIDKDDPELSPELKEHLKQFNQEDWDTIHEFSQSLRELGDVLLEAYQ